MARLLISLTVDDNAVDLLRESITNEATGDITPATPEDWNYVSVLESVRVWLNRRFRDNDHGSVLSFNDPRQVTPQIHIWTEDKLPWIPICDNLPVFARDDLPAHPQNPAA